MNWYKKNYRSDPESEYDLRKRRSPEDPEQIYQYYYGDDDQPDRLNYMDYYARDYGKPPIEMTSVERRGIIEKETEDNLEKGKDKIERVIAWIQAKHGAVNMDLIKRYEYKFPNFTLQYILNYVKKKGLIE